MQADLGSVEGHGGLQRIDIKHAAQAPIEAVWDAITIAEQVGLWWPGHWQIDCREGGKITHDPRQVGTIKVALKPNILSYIWHDDAPEKEFVQFSLMPSSDKTTLITLTSFVRPLTNIVMCLVPWHLAIERIAAIVEGKAVDLEDESRAKELYVLYSDRTKLHGGDT